MPFYRYKAIDSAGKVTEDKFDAEDLERLAEILKCQGLFLMEARPLPQQPASTTPSSKASSATGRRAARSAASSSDPAAWHQDARVSLKDLTIFTTQFLIMMRTAIPILDILRTLSEQQRNLKFKKVIMDVYKNVRQGVSLSSAFSKFPTIFDDVYISLLSAGEASGTMDTMLDRISRYLNFQRSIRMKTRSAFVYPSIVVVTSMGVVAFMVFFILPTFMEIFSHFNLELPWITQMLIDASENIRQWWWAYILGGGGIWFYMANWLKDPFKTRTFHRWQLKFPLVGPFVRNIVLTRILRTLGALVASGVPILKALDLARESASNLVFDDALKKVSQSTSHGKGLASALMGNPHFPPMVIDMIQTAEKTGTLPEVLNKISDHFEEETDVALRDLLASLEPLLVVVLGLTVGFIAVAVLLPLYQLGGDIAG